MADTINAQQCAELLQCNSETVEELTRKGELPAVKFGRGWIYVKSDLLAYLAEKARNEAQERRIEVQKKLSQPAATTALRPVKSRRRVPPALPQVAMPTAVGQGLRP